MWQGFKKSFGPGLIMAAAAIGVSHLVQSTRAGAEYGFLFVWAVLLANIFKYPFLEFGPRYAIATGKNMIRGYAGLGNWAIWFFIIFTLGTMFAIHAAVTVVTASLAAQLTGISLSAVAWSAILLILCIAVLIRDSYSILDRGIKIIMVVLVISTMVAVIAALFQADYHAMQTAEAPIVWSAAGIAFLIALMGWMPIPIDASVWHSIWTLERIEQTKYKPTLVQSITDFNIGYIGAAVVALCFLTLGALIMFGTGQSFAASGAEFSHQLIYLYTSTLGDWSYVIITICAFTTMLSTTFTVTDTYPRVCKEILKTMLPNSALSSHRHLYRYLLVGISCFSLAFLAFMGDRFRFMIDLATTLSFLTAPVLAYINYRLIFSDDVSEEFRPKPWLQWLAIAGILFLTLFSLIYLYWMILQ